MHMCACTQTHFLLSETSWAYILAASVGQGLPMCSSHEHGRIQAQLCHRLAFRPWPSDIFLSKPQFPHLLNGTNNLLLKGEYQRQMKFFMERDWLGPNLFNMSPFPLLGA